MKRQAVVDDLGRGMGLLPKGFRKSPRGNFEAGSRDAEGVRHIQGIYHIERIEVGPKYTGPFSPEEAYGLFPLHWLE